MSKQEMIQQIRRINRTASNEFLDTFKENELRSYLLRLTQLRNQRGRSSVWIRQGETHAVVTKAA